MTMSAGPTGGNIIPKGYKRGQISQFTPEQVELFRRAFSQVSPDSFTSRLAGGDPELFEQIEAPAFRQFSQLQGQMGSRFSGMGSGARKSSGFQNAMGGAASDFAQQLQSQRMGLQRQATQDLMGMVQSLLGQRPYEQFLVPKQKPFWQEFLASMGGGLGQGIGSLPMLFM